MIFKCIKMTALRRLWASGFVPEIRPYLRWISKLCLLLAVGIFVINLFIQGRSPLWRTLMIYGDKQLTEAYNLSSIPSPENNFFAGLSVECKNATMAKSITVPTISQYYCHIQELCRKEDINFTGDPNMLCPCPPENLRGPRFPDFSNLLSITWSELTNQLDAVKAGGYWQPAKCAPRRKLAVIIPYRDRERHLRAFLAHYHPLFQSHLLEYQIFIVEQNQPYIFNKASVMNAGFLESQKMFDADCILFHDIDTFAERDDNVIICGDKPIHWANYVNRTYYAFIPTHFGGAILLSKDQFLKMNGYSNVYWGWGGEDDDFLNRVNYYFRGYDIIPNELGKFSLIYHERDPTFEHNSRRFTLSKYSKKFGKVHSEDGLNTVRYKVLSQERRPLYTWILLDILEPDLKKLSSFAYKSAALASYRKNGGAYIASKYQQLDGHCDNIPKKNNTVFYKSKATCRYLCEKKTKHCLGFQYHEVRDLDSYCVLLLESCKISTDMLQEPVALFIIEQFLGSFNKVDMPLNS